jgi:hypothetical protein
MGTRIAVHPVLVGCGGCVLGAVRCGVPRLLCVRVCVRAMVPPVGAHPVGAETGTITATAKTALRPSPTGSLPRCSHQLALPSVACAAVAVVADTRRGTMLAPHQPRPRLPWGVLLQQKPAVSRGAHSGPPPPHHPNARHDRDHRTPAPACCTLHTTPCTHCVHFTCASTATQQHNSTTTTSQRYLTDGLQNTPADTGGVHTQVRISARQGHHHTPRGPKLPSAPGPALHLQV